MERARFFSVSLFVHTVFVVVVVVVAASRLFPAGTFHAVSQSVHPAEEFGPQHSGQHPVKGTQTLASSRAEYRRSHSSLWPCRRVQVSTRLL